MDLLSGMFSLRQRMNSRSRKLIYISTEFFRLARSDLIFVTPVKQLSSALDMARA
jgi:hypothetical protein